MPFARARDGTRLYYEELGAGDALLLVMGQGSDHHGWDLVRGDFADRYRVVVYDHRGTGQSDKPREPAYSTRGFAQDAIDLLDHLGIGKAHAYGISMGGRIGQWLAIDHGGRMGAVVLGCTTPGNAHGARRAPEVDAHMADRPSDPMEAMAFLMAQMVSPEWSEAHPEWVDSLKERARNPIPAFAQKLHYLASEGHDSWEGLPRITNPVLVIHGDSDTVNPSANAALLAGRIPGAELCMITGGRHGYFLEFREQASAAVLDFLARHPLG